MKFKWLALILPFLLCACASYQSEVSGPREMLKRGQFSEALEKFKVLSEKEGRDQLVMLMEYATALQIAGRYKESSEVFLKADKMVDMNDYHSISNITAATLGSETMIQYKGESYEKFLLNTMNAINYLMMNQLDDALVEARQINEKINKMRMDGRDPYEQSPFAHYLAGVLWEAERKFDDAYIDYEATYKLNATNPFLPTDLLRSAKLSRREESFDKWKKEFPDIKLDPKYLEKSTGQLVVIYQQGWGAEKRQRPGQYRFPALFPVFSETKRALVEIEGFAPIKTEDIYNITAVSIRILEKDFGALVARRTGGIVAKAIVADQIRQKNALAGDLAWIAMNLADRPDLRHWSLLPESIQMARIPLKSGKYKVKIQGLNNSGEATADSLETREIEIKPGKITFLNWRSLR
jgi:uncharacterized protein